MASEPAHDILSLVKRDCSEGDLLGIHDHRFQLSRAVRQAYDRVAGAMDGIDADQRKPGQLSRWPRLLIGFGAAITTLWMVILGWLVLRLVWQMMHWLKA
jgi:hypothetical protein